MDKTCNDCIPLQRDPLDFNSYTKEIAFSRQCYCCFNQVLAASAEKCRCLPMVKSQASFFIIYIFLAYILYLLFLHYILAPFIALGKESKCLNESQLQTILKVKPSEISLGFEFFCLNSNPTTSKILAQISIIQRPLILIISLFKFKA